MRTSWVALLLLCLSSTALARDVLDKTESPYFVVPDVDARLDPLPLREVAVHADISGVVADVSVTQLWENTGAVPLDATYVFPLSSRAAVHALEMRIGGRRIVATIKEKEEARRIYEAAKAEGKTATLLEQSRPNMFTTKVANIPPGEVVEVELKYVELLLPEDGAFAFRVPKVVGPRYVSPKETAPDVPWSVIDTGDSRPEPTLHAWPISVSLEGGVPLLWASSSTHAIEVEKGDEVVAIELAQDPESVDASQDFVLDYALGDEDLATGVLAESSGDGGYFLALVAPPERLDPALIPAREYVFIVDTSGSMHGWPLDTAKRLIGTLVDDLDSADRINVLCFSGDADFMAPQAVVASAANKRRAKTFLSEQMGGGSTELLQALERAFASPATPGMARTFVVVTDGAVTVEAKAIDLIRDRRGDANVFAIGIGPGRVNEYLLAAVANAGGGEPYIATNEAMTAAVAERFLDDVRSPVLTDIAFSFEGIDVYDLEPKSIPTLYASRPLLVSGRYRGAAGGSLTVTGKTGIGAWSSKTAIVGGHHPAVPLLWARERIARLSDYAGAYDAPKHQAEITALGLKYALVTQHTSFTAVDDGVDVAAAAAEAPPQALEDGLMAMRGTGTGGGGSGFGRIGGMGGIDTGGGFGEPKKRIAPPTARMKIVTDSKDRVDSALLRRRQAALDYCLVNQTSFPPGQRLVWKLEIDATGAVTRMTLVGPSIDAQVETCVRRTLTRTKFPATQVRVLTLTLSSEGIAATLE